MITLQQTYKAVVQGMADASRDPEFDSRMLMGGKRVGPYGRERWLCERVSKALADAGFNAKPELDRIDIAILNSAGNLEEVIEAKFLWCLHCYQPPRTGHKFFVNVKKDMTKRSHLDRPHKAIVFVADYQSMHPNGEGLGLYHAKVIKKHLAKHRAGAGEFDCCGFGRFERDLFAEFGEEWEVFPRRGSYPPDHTWMAEHLGASELIRAWVLGVRT